MIQKIISISYSNLLLRMRAQYSHCDSEQSTAFIHIETGKMKKEKHTYSFVLCK